MRVTRVNFPAHLTICVENTDVSRVSQSRGCAASTPALAMTPGSRPTPIPAPTATPGAGVGVSLEPGAGAGTGAALPRLRLMMIGV